MNAKRELQDINPLLLESFNNAHICGVRISEKKVLEIQDKIDSGKISDADAVDFVNSISKYHLEKGYAWYRPVDPDPANKVLWYLDRQGKGAAIVSERANLETQQKFYSADRITPEGARIKLSSNDRLEKVMEHVEAYYVGVAANIVAKAMAPTVERPAVVQASRSADRSISIEM